MNTVNMPGFTAETSLYGTMTNYRAKGVHGSLPGPGAVVPQPGPAQLTAKNQGSFLPIMVCGELCCPSNADPACLPRKW